MSRKPLEFSVPSAYHNLLLMLLVILFHNPVSIGYVWDDTLLIELNPWKDSLSNIGFVWTNSLWSGIPGEHVNHWYRPLMGTHILIDQWLFGDALGPKQWMNVVWFTGVVMLLNRWLYSILELSRRQSLWIVSLLIVHPYSVELTQFIAARNDTMALAFAMGIPFLIQRSPNALNHAWIALLFFCTMCSKESGLMWVCLLTLPIYTKLGVYWKSLVSGGGLWLLLKANASLDPMTLSREWLTVLQTWTHTGTYWVLTSTPLQPVPESVSVIGLLVIGIMMFYTRNRTGYMGLIIFLVGGLLAAIASEESTTLGFRYLWIPVLGQTLWLVSSLPNKTRPVLIIPLIVLGIKTIEERTHWIDNTAFWEHGYHNHPNQHTACGSFMTLRETPLLAIDRLKRSIAAPPKLHCCAQASRYPLEIGDMTLTIKMGTEAIENGCPKIPELLAPMAMATAVMGDWSRSMNILSDYSTDPFGYKPLLETAYGFQHNDEAPLKHWTTAENPLLPGTTASEREDMLRSQVNDLLQMIESYSHSE